MGAPAAAAGSSGVSKWLLPTLLGVGGAASGVGGAKSSGQPTTTEYNNRKMLERPDFTNWAFTPEQNEQHNMSDIFLGDIFSMMQNLLRNDLGAFITSQDVSSRKKYKAGG
jgi:hypothetical protein